MRTTVSKGIEGYKAAFEAQRAADIAKVRPADVNGYKPQLPKTFEGKLQLHVGEVDSSKLDPNIGHYKLDAADPLLGWWRETAFKLGLGQEAFEEGLGAYAGSMLARQPNYEAEMKLLGDNGKTRVDGAKNWLKANVDEGAFKVFERVAATAAGCVAIEQLITKAGGPKLANGGTPPPPPDNGTLTEPQLRTMMRDPRYHDPGRRDEAFVKQVKEGWAKLRPGKLAANNTKTTA